MSTQLKVADRPLVANRDNLSGFPHVAALDGIRGLAILCVLAHHLLWSNPSTGSRFLDGIQRLEEGTYGGVNLFFALSGFLITGILIDTLSVPSYFKTYYARRALRIFPLYYGSLAVLLLLTRPMHFEWNGWQYYLLTYTQNLALWRTSVPLELGRVNINHFWSLQVEEQFYLVWPFVVYRFKRPALLARVALIACVFPLLLRFAFVTMRGHPHFTWVYLPYSPTFSCADNLLFGCALAALLRTSARSRILRFAPAALAVCVAALALTFVLDHGFEWTTSWFMPTFGFTLLGLASASLIAATLVDGSPAQFVLKGRLFRFFGRYSYGLYVVHYSIAGYVLLPLRAAVVAHLHSKILGVLLPAAATGLIAVLAAWLSYHFYEAAFLQLKRFFPYLPEKKISEVTLTVPPAVARAFIP